MSGYRQYNFPAFHAMEARLLARGHRVINPARNFWGITWLPYWFYMTWDLLQLGLVPSDIVLLKGWRKSKGARIEARFAEMLGLRRWNSQLRRIK